VIPSLRQIVEDNPDMRIDLPEGIRRRDYENFIIALANHNDVFLFEQIYALTFVNSTDLIKYPKIVEHALGDLLLTDRLPIQISIYIRNNIPHTEMMSFILRCIKFIILFDHMDAIKGNGVRETIL
jgi:hypothetical protein